MKNKKFCIKCDKETRHCEGKCGRCEEKERRWRMWSTMITLDRGFARHMDSGK
jgi:predicted amidophosphoribosyltransferase